jgi:hypothetical protein
MHERSINAYGEWRWLEWASAIVVWLMKSDRKVI